MKIKDVIAYVDAIKPNAFPDEVKVQWINEVEGFIQTDVMLLDILEVIRYSFPDDYETELLVLPPHSKIYYAYLTAMVDFANGEYNKYANTMQIYNTFLGEYMEWYTMKYRPADGTAVAHGYYISAYGIAVKHGYVGSEEQWIESLKGEKGEPFRYEDFTKEQLELLRGPAGESIKSIETTDIEQPDGSIRHVVEVTTTKGQIERFYVDDGKNYILTEADRDEIADRAVVKTLYTAEWGSVTVAELDEAYYAGKTLQLKNTYGQIAHLQMAQPGSVYDFVLPLNRGSVEGGVDTSSEITIRVYRVSISGDTILTYSAPNARGNGYVSTSAQELTQDQQTQALANMGTEGVYTAQYGVTTFAEINEAMNAGKKIFLSVPGGHTVPLSHGVAGFTYMFIQLLSAAAWNPGESAPEEMEAVVRIYRITNSGKWEFAQYELNSGGGGGGISKETDPTVPDWAKRPEKPTYTADEVGALPATTKIPAKTSELTNDSGFITRISDDLENYYTKKNSYSRTEIDEKISVIPKFSIEVVSELPTSDISSTTVYLVGGGLGSDLYVEYIYVNGAWEILGAQRVDLTGYAKETWVAEQISTLERVLSADISGAQSAARTAQRTADDAVGMFDSIPAWAKQPNKPTYTADEVGALPAATKIPAKTSDLQNDSGFITKAVTDLANYYAKSQTYNRDEINERISAIPKFAISVVSALPTSGISTTTIYLVKSGSGADLYTEYIYTDGAWEILGSQRVDLTGYATEAWVNAKIADFLTADKLTAEMVTGALGFTPAQDTDVPAVDSTLKVSGAAADAKAVGDKVNQLSEEIADYDTLGLGVHTDGKVYIYKNGVPFGNGIKIASGGDVVGTLDENNDIVLTGSLADGTYTLKYENADGTFTEIGNLVINTDTTVYYSVTNNLTYCANSNSAEQVAEGSAYSAAITANSGFELKTVTVTMGGTDITSSVVSGGNISIAEVTGDIVITAVAEEVVEEVVNWITNSQNSDGSLFVGTNGEAGYKPNTRLGTSDGGERTQSGVECTGFIPVTSGDTLYFKGVTITSATSETTCWYDSSHTLISGGGSSTYTIFGTMSGEVTAVKISDIKASAPANNPSKIAYVRISASVIDANSIITKNQPIE